ncbi:MAG: helix-turn-helix transcriptional regulator [Bacillota bacterium]|jgi:putative transcriptional regulator|nr:helix-turn-helix transcriptional regulator [Bacillota bacterium]
MIVKEYRIEKNITQEKLAELTGVTRSYISKIETGVAKPSVPVARRIGKVLKFDWTKFFPDDSE